MTVSLASDTPRGVRELWVLGPCTWCQWPRSSLAIYVEGVLERLCAECRRLVLDNDQICVRVA